MGKVLFDQTIAADAASIDTGTGGIPTGVGWPGIEVLFVGRCTYAVAVSTSEVALRFNNDSGSNYYYQDMAGVNTTASAANIQAAPETGHRVQMPGTSVADGATAAVMRLWLPSYDVTTWYKDGVMLNGLMDAATAANCFAREFSTHWASTVAVSRIAIVALGGGGGLLKAGSRLVVSSWP